MMLSGKTMLAGVLGWPIGHSKSPRLHGFWLDRLGIDGAYVPLPVRPSDLERVLRALPCMGFKGVNLTLPHKEAALSIVDFADPLAKTIGAVNTIVVRDDGSLEGRNTDAFGFAENLRQHCPDFRGVDKTAVVLGAGGAARAVIAGLTEAGFTEIRLVNRTLSRAQELAAKMAAPTSRTIVPTSWDERAQALESAGLLVNTTQLGMSGQPPLELELAVLPKDAVVYDIVYAPLETALLKTAAARGNPVVDGLGMLLHQARPAFAAWFGTMPDVTAELREMMVAS